MLGLFTKKKVLLVFGNSHLNAFRRCFDRLINKNEIDFDIHYVVSGLLKVPWGDFRENNYLKHLVYQDNMAPSINIASWRYEVKIVLVGMGMLGSGVFTPFGPVRNVPRDMQDKAGEYTPKLPLLSGINCVDGKVPRHTTELISDADAVSIYEKYYRQKLNKISNLYVDGRYQSLYWIAEPDMIESVGKFRFGEDLINCGLYARHKLISNSVIKPLINEYGFQEKIIAHPDDYILESGLVNNRFKSSIIPSDHHVSPDFYSPSALQLAKSLNIPIKNE